MKYLFFLPCAVLLFFSCTNSRKEPAGRTGEKDTKVSLRTDTLNVVKLTDTLVIYESVCRGCAYEQSTHFDISDSMNIIKMIDVVTTDNNPPDMSGGNVSKDLILVPLNTGTTIIKMYKFWQGRTVSAADSSHFTRYTIEVRN
ncbi:MAG: hypothetical protein ABI688_07320 [Bacteroidota bacterium]